MGREKLYKIKLSCYAGEILGFLDMLRYECRKCRVRKARIVNEVDPTYGTSKIEVVLAFKKEPTFDRWKSFLLILKEMTDEEFYQGGW